jgi:hypothetical protein
MDGTAHRAHASCAARSLVALIAVAGLVVVGAMTTATASTSTRPLVGTSFGGTSVTTINTTTALFPNASVGRYYFSGNPGTYEGSPLSAIPAGETIFVSFKTTVATVESGADNAAFAAILQDWNASGRTIYWTWQHEADAPTSGIAPADYVAGWNQLLSVEAANPAPNVHSMSILTGSALNTNAPHGPLSQWFVPADAVGFDVYNLTQEPLAEAYATSVGKPLAFPEFGNVVAPNTATDAAALSFAQSFVANLTPNVFAASWWNSLGTSLTGKPLTTAYLGTLP